jgi:four helix bundle protein
MNNKNVGGLPILEKTYELILWIYPTVNKFPKSQRFVLGQRIENGVLKIVEEIIEMRIMVGREEKLKQLQKISTEMDKLRILIRIAKDLKFIKTKQYIFVTEKINEMGKMLGGWIRVYGKEKIHAE